MNENILKNIMVVRATTFVKTLKMENENNNRVDLLQFLFILAEFLKPFGNIILCV